MKNLNRPSSVGYETYLCLSPVSASAVHSPEVVYRAGRPVNQSSWFPRSRVKRLTKGGNLSRNDYLKLDLLLKPVKTSSFETARPEKLVITERRGSQSWTLHY